MSGSFFYAATSSEVSVVNREAIHALRACLASTPRRRGVDLCKEELNIALSLVLLRK